MTTEDLLRRYRDFDPVTGEFDEASRLGLREYALLLGMDAGHLSRILNGKTPAGRTVLEKLARTFPSAAPEIIKALVAAPERETAEVA